MPIPVLTCVFPDCSTNRERDFWCHKHWGLFPHKCKHNDCDSRVSYDDEPFCFTHSPDEGSSFRGYSAYLEQREIDDPWVQDDFSVNVEVETVQPLWAHENMIITKIPDYPAPWHVRVTESGPVGDPF